ncbi:MCE family protein [Mycolicibacterium sp. 120266]|nr:MCE family protein [Mycolicibacterium sp. 120266]MDX1873880.1 MCE family protein [Mycolicibacterium sp. 120266]
MTAALLAVALPGGVGALVVDHVRAPLSIDAYFTSVTGVYAGDEVRIAGVKVGNIASITPAGDRVKMGLTVHHGVSVPANANAVIVAPNLISARFVQLTPAYEDAGPTMASGAVIPIERTAAPVEWDEVKRQLTRLATDLGPRSDVSTTSAGRFIDSAANAMNGNGVKLRDTLAQLSGAGRILAGNSGDLVAVIENLQTFVTALRDSNEQIVQFQGRLATVSSVLNGSRSDLDSALRNVADVVGEVQQFVSQTRDPASEQIQRLADVTSNLVQHKQDLEQILHVAPNALANTVNFFDPRDGAINGVFGFNEFSNPIQFICSAIGAVENVTASESSKLCAQYLGPALRTLNFNYLPFPVHPFLSSAPTPDQMVYTEPGLAPGGTGGKPGPPETPPAVSAYTGAGDVAPPPGYGPPPAPPSPSLPGLLLPATQPAPPDTPPNTPPGPLLPAEATPAPPTAPAPPQEPQP